MTANGAQQNIYANFNPLAGNPKYDTVKVLGAGSFGIVQLAANR